MNALHLSFVPPHDMSGLSIWATDEPFEQIPGQPTKRPPCGALAAFSPVSNMLHVHFASLSRADVTAEERIAAFARLDLAGQNTLPPELSDQIHWSLRRTAEERGRLTEERERLIELQDQWRAAGDEQVRLEDVKEHLLYSAQEAADWKAALFEQHLLLQAVQNDYNTWGAQQQALAARHVVIADHLQQEAAQNELQRRLNAEGRVDAQAECKKWQVGRDNFEKAKVEEEARRKERWEVAQAEEARLKALEEKNRLERRQLEAEAKAMEAEWKRRGREEAAWKAERVRAGVEAAKKREKKRKEREREQEQEQRRAEQEQERLRAEKEKERQRAEQEQEQERRRAEQEQKDKEEARRKAEEQRQRQAPRQAPTTPPPDRSAVDAWEAYVAAWAGIKRGQYTLYTVPWPMMEPPRKLEDITLARIENFILSPHHLGELDRRKRIKDMLLLFHPDQSNRVLGNVVEPQKVLVKEGVELVTKFLNQLKEKYTPPPPETKTPTASNQA